MAYVGEVLVEGEAFVAGEDPDEPGYGGHDVEVGYHAHAGHHDDHGCGGGFGSRPGLVSRRCRVVGIKCLRGVEDFGDWQHGVANGIGVSDAEHEADAERKHHYGIGRSGK